MKKTVARIMIRIYGIRSALRPPIGGSRFYWIKHQWWMLTEKVYRWSGVPDRWHKGFHLARNADGLRYAASKYRHAQTDEGNELAWRLERTAKNLDMRAKELMHGK